MEQTITREQATYGCDDCKYLKIHSCKLWQVKVDDPHNSHCESFAYTWDTEAKEAKCQQK